jgi:hypothetical protein
VKSLMQAQHKAALRSLKAGSFDDKISSYLADQPGLEPALPRHAARDTSESLPPPPYGLPPAPQRGPAPPAPPPLIPVGRSDAARTRAMRAPAMPGLPSDTTNTDDVSAAFRLIKREPTQPGDTSDGVMLEPPEPAPAPAAGRRRAGHQTGYSLHRTGQLELMPEIHDQPTAPIPRGKGRAPAVVTPIAPRPPDTTARPAGKHAPPTPAPRATPRPQPPAAPPMPRASVVVSRPPVIVGAPPRIVSPREGGPPVPRTIRRARESARPSLFGKDLISERSLDEVILAYLSEDASEK